MPIANFNVMANVNIDDNGICQLQISTSMDTVANANRAWFMCLELYEMSVMQ